MVLSQRSMSQLAGGASPTAAASRGGVVLAVKMMESGNSLWHVKSSFSCIALKVSLGTITHVDRKVLSASKWFSAMRKARQSKTKRRVV